VTLLEERHVAYETWREASERAAELLRRIALVEREKRHHTRSLWR